MSWRLLAVGCALALQAAGLALGQSAESPNPEAADHQTDSDAQAMFRAPLIREGSSIIDAAAHLEADPAHNSWKMIIAQSDSRMPANELIVLPCTRLSEMQRILEASPQRQVMFQITAKVFVFRARNYVLPLQASVLTEAQSPPSNDSSAASSPPAAAEAPNHSSEQPSPESATPSKSSSSAADIMRDLDKATGPLVRSAAADLPDRPTRTDEDRRMSGGSSTNREHLMAEESSIVNRRGKIVRDPSGGWKFVFDADANGLADPPVHLLPCSLLERIEDYARRQGNNSPALMSGPVYLYNGQNYLLPTVFRIPQERRNISP